MGRYSLSGGCTGVCVVCVHSSPPSPPHPPPLPAPRWVELQFCVSRSWNAARLVACRAAQQRTNFCTYVSSAGQLCAHPHVFNVHCAAPSTSGQGGVALPPGQPRCLCSHLVRVTCVSIVEYCPRIFGNFRPTPIWLHSHIVL